MADIHGQQQHQGGADHVLLERRQHILVHRVHHRVRRRNVRQAGYDGSRRAQLLYRLDVYPDSGDRRGLQLPVQLPEKRVPAGKEDGRVLPVHGVLRGY